MDRSDRCIGPWLQILTNLPILTSGTLPRRTLGRGGLTSAPYIFSAGDGPTFHPGDKRAMVKPGLARGLEEFYEHTSDSSTDHRHGSDRHSVCFGHGAHSMGKGNGHRLVRFLKSKRRFRFCAGFHSCLLNVGATKMGRLAVPLKMGTGRIPAE